MREFDTGYLVIVRKQVTSIRKYGVAQKLVLKTKGPYRVLNKGTPILYWIQCFTFCEGLGRPRRKVKESAARMKKIPSTMVLQKHVDGADTRFSTKAGPLTNNPLVKWLGLIRRCSYQEASEDSRWAYEPLSDLWTEIEPDSDSNDDGSSDEGRKYHDKLDHKEQE